MIVLQDKLINAMKEAFGNDEKRKNHAQLVLKHALDISLKEGGDLVIIVAAALLHDIGILEAERKYGLSTGKYQEIEGPPLAKRIMENIGLESSTIEHVCRIIGNHYSGKNIDSLEFRILWDADWLVNFPDEYAFLEKNKLRNTIDKIFRTRTGKMKAYQMFLNHEVD